MEIVTCKIEWCPDPVHARGWCSRHYRNWLNRGHELNDSQMRKTPEQRFWEKVDFAGPAPPLHPELGGCWLWIAGVGKGYGAFTANGRSHVSHKFAYELLIGPVPEGLVLDHLCEVKICCNPDHLEPVTSAVNTQRGKLSEVSRARWTAITHCPQGHLYDETNTIYRERDGYMTRGCRECTRIATNQWYANKILRTEGREVRDYPRVPKPYPTMNMAFVFG